MANPTLKHAFVSAKADGPDSTLIKPSDWNAEHELEATDDNVILGRISPGGGPIEELPLVREALDAGTMWTGAKIQAAITAAINALPQPTTIPVGATVGWYSNTLPAGQRWLFCNGLTIGGASSGANHANATYNALFLFLWNNIAAAELPIFSPAGAPTIRGASAAVDWAANKRLSLPDECGRVGAGANNMGGIASKNRITVLGGINGDTLGAAGATQTLLHKHTGTTDANADFISTSGGGQTTANGAHTHDFETANATVSTLQPTIIKNVLIRY